jgi:hypothetical protein
MPLLLLLALYKNDQAENAASAANEQQNRYVGDYQVDQGKYL